MTAEAKKLKKALREAGLSNRVINAAWPEWWSKRADASTSAKAELCFAVARKLGLSPKPLLDEQVEFVWRDKARFKHITAETDLERDALGSFGVSIGRQLIAMTPSPQAATPSISADTLRTAILAKTKYVDLLSLLSTCWAIGIPVVHLRVFPLRAKAMHAMVATVEGRYAILLGRNASYPAPIAFTLAHELGHAMLNHLEDNTAIVELDDPGSEQSEDDNEELDADRYALSLLTGSERPIIQADKEEFGAKALARAVLDVAPSHRIEPGTLAMCFAHQTKRWPTGIASLRHIYQEAKPVWNEVNAIAAKQLDWSAISDDAADYLRNVMDQPNA